MVEHVDQVSGPPPGATEGFLRRGWRDFVTLSRGHYAFNILVGVAGAAGAAAAELAPADATTAGRFLFTGATALGAFLVSYLLTLGWSVLRAPFRQRRELIDFLDPGKTDFRPELMTVPGVETRSGAHDSGKKDRFGQPVLAEDTMRVAQIRVFNGQEHGGEAASAKHVIPELRVYGGDDLVFHWKGWDTTAWRDFTTGQEEHALWIAAKWESEAECFVIRTQNAEAVKLLPAGSYRVELILRCHFPDGPIRREFTLVNHGAAAGLDLHSVEPAG